MSGVEWIILVALVLGLGRWAQPSRTRFQKPPVENNEPDPPFVLPENARPR